MEDTNIDMLIYYLEKIVSDTDAKYIVLGCREEYITHLYLSISVLQNELYLRTKRKMDNEMRRFGYHFSRGPCFKHRY